MNKKQTLLSLLLSLSYFAYSQSYNFSTTTGAYVNLSNSTSLNTTMPWDDPEFTIPIGFDFNYFDTTINQIYIDDWGLGASLTPNPNEAGTLPILIPYGADIIDRGFDFNNENSTTGSLSNISYALEGSTGDRILKIEWKNVGFHSDILENGTSTDFTNFQMWLYEGSNDIEIHFGPNSITNLDQSFDGDSGSSIALIPAYNFNTDILEEEAIFLSGNPSNPTTILSTQDDNNFLNGVIPNGTIYRFTRSTLSTEEFQPNNSVEIKLFPNPSKNSIYFAGILNTEKYEIYNLIGNKIAEGIVQNDQKIDISRYQNGIYLIKMDRNIIKFTKN